MKQFIKIVIASSLGFMVSLVLLGFTGFYFFGSASKHSKKLEKSSVLRIELDQYIPELSNNISEDYFLTPTNNLGLIEIKNIIKHAAKDDKIAGMVISSKSISTGQASLQSIRKEIEKFKTSQKFVWSYADYYSQTGYWLSSVSDSIFMNPNGSVDLKGYGSAMRFYKDLLDKVGVDMNIYYAGKYKSATEPYRRNSISTESREQLLDFLTEMKDIMVADISKSRNISVEKVDHIIDHFFGGYPESCVAYKLVDKLVYWEEFEEKLKSELAKKDISTTNFIDLKGYKNYVEPVLDGTSKNKIAVVVAEGTIMYGSTSKGEISEGKYRKIFEKIKKDTSYKAVVFRINSPGGNSIDSDNINHIIRLLKKSGLPIIASLGDYAASGGYYIGCNADTIVASANTLTGSIGVYIMFPNVQELLHTKLGVVHDTIKTDPYAISFTSILDLTPKEKDHIQKNTDDLYAKFLKEVAIGRQMNVAEVDKIAQGRVWTGAKAKELGLVDEIGDLDYAIELAAEKANIEEYSISYYPKIKVSPLKQIMESFLPEENPVSVEASSMVKEINNVLGEIKNISSQRTPLAHLPFQFFWD